MNLVARILKSIFDEFGGKSIHTTGRNAYVIIVSRALRMFAHGTVTMILGAFQHPMLLSILHLTVFT